MKEEQRTEPLAGRSPEDVLANPIRRLCRFEYSCRLCGLEHHLENYISISARNFQEYKTLLARKLEDQEFVRSTLRQASIDFHQGEGDLERLTAKARENGLYPGENEINVIITRESDYTCSHCSATFGTSQVLRDHMAGCAAKT